MNSDAYVFTIGESQFRFRRPETQDLDSYFANIKTLQKANQILSTTLIAPEDKVAWGALISRKPGYSAQVVGKIIQDLGFGDDATLGNA